MNAAGAIDCASLLHWALPRLGLAWAGFRRVHRQVCKRLKRRLRVLGLADFASYQIYLDGHPGEWQVLDALCRIPISRFFRDGDVFQKLGDEILPALADAACGRGQKELRAWSAGCASGEEPYSIAMVWGYRIAQQFPEISLEIAATDADRNLLARAEQACYRRGSLGELPHEWIADAFDRRNDLFALKTEWRECVNFTCHDIRDEPPFQFLDLILCRNLAFTYFDAEQQLGVLCRFVTALRPGGGLVIGRAETFPEGAANLAPWLPRIGIYRKLGP